MNNKTIQSLTKYYIWKSINILFLFYKYYNLTLFLPSGLTGEAVQIIKKAEYILHELETNCKNKDGPIK